ncbi:Eco57I restriction-modification methylase domain-containing protein [Metamycoplasma gateae]
MAHKNSIIDSYFNNKIQADIIIGNPPYVDFKNIGEEIKKRNTIIT